MIEVRGLTKYYGARAAIQDVSFHVAAGEVLGILGPKSAGKTTAMRIIAGYLPASAGQVRLAGYDVAAQPLEARRCAGYLPQTTPLYHEMTVRAHLDFLADLRGVRKRKERVERIMELCRLTPRANQPIRKLPRGTRQWVGLAATLLHDPPVLILDEPTAGMEPAQIIEARDLIRELGRTRSILLSTHILSEVEHICERVLILHAGRVIAEDSRDQLRLRLKGSESLYVRVAGASPAQVISELLAMPGVRDVQFHGDGYHVAGVLGADLRAETAARIVGRGWQLLELRPEGVSFEDIFQTLTPDERPAIPGPVQ